MTMSNRGETTFSTPSDREIEYSRVMHAPRHLVFDAYTQEEHLRQWWGPKDFTTPHVYVDLRPGGVWHYCMRAPDGQESWGRAVYQEIVPPERLVYEDAFSDKDGNVYPPTMLITVNFTDEAGKTRITSRVRFASREDRDKVLEMGAIEGMNQTLDKLAALLARP